jgi:hypothetical protein
MLTNLVNQIMLVLYPLMKARAEMEANEAIFITILTLREERTQRSIR